jgi:hypothetical protein
MEKIPNVNIAKWQRFIEFKAITSARYLASRDKIRL